MLSDVASARSQTKTRLPTLSELATDVWFTNIFTSSMITEYVWFTTCSRRRQNENRNNWCFMIACTITHTHTPRLQAGQPGLDPLQEQFKGLFIFATASRQAPGPIQPPIQWISWALSLGIKRPGREADHSPPSSAEVNELLYTSTSQIRLYGVVLS